MQTKQRSLLLVDDSKTYQAMVHSMLSDAGFEVVSCESGQQALSVLNERYIDFICTALQLVDIDGIALCQRIRALPASSHKPVALLTSRDIKGVLSQAMCAGITDVFHKSDIQELIAFIKRFPYLDDPLQGKVLYIEDSRSQREVVSAMLHGFGLHVDACPQAEEAWQLFLSNHYDVVITDIVLEGDISGVHLVNRIRRQYSSKGDTPILTLTAFDNRSRRMELLSLGITDYLVKPIDEKELYVRLHRLLNKRDLQAELQARENYYRLSFEHIPLGMAKLALNGKLLQVNQYWQRQLGFDNHYLTSVSLQEITHPDDRAECASCFNQFITNRTNSLVKEWRLLAENGAIVWASISLTVLKDEHNTSQYVISAMQDITEAKVLRDQITRAYDQYQHMLATTADGFWLLGLDGNIEDVNDAYVELSGYSRDELLNMNITDLDIDLTPTKLKQSITHIVNEKRDLFEAKHRTKQGRVLDLEISITYQQSIEKFVCFLRDISIRNIILQREKQARKEAESSLQRAVKAERQLLKVYEDTCSRLGQELHDDVGQQITAVALLSETLTKDLIKNQNAHCQESQKITNRLNQALARIRQLSHGLCPAAHEHTDLITMLEWLAEETTNLHSLTCVCRVKGTTNYHLYFDNGELPIEELNIQLFRVAQEAVNNAIKHSKGSKIEILLEQTPKGDVLKITDNGNGLSNIEKPGGLGIYSMKFRTNLIGADIEFISIEGGGLSVVVSGSHANKID